ncbi:MAG: autotransporter outer membrane beta-barrel domain-containing protein [Burkholderiales bacterium]|nr:autotransporter outer membrane beta-barrel domain-containing protein [Burkholderiales bacterium]
MTTRPQSRTGLTGAAAVLAAVAGMFAAPAALANGCLPGYSQYYLCLAGDSGKGTLRNAVSTPTLHSATFLGQLSGMGGRNAFAGLAAPRYALDGETGAAAAGGAPRWNVWFAAGENQQAYTFQPARSEGRSTLALGGVDYTFAGNIVAGVAVNIDRTRSIFQANLNSPLTVNGHSIAPYVSIPFARNWLFDASVGFGESRIKVTDYNAPAEGDTKSDRTFVSLALSYAARTGNWALAGKANYVETSDKIASFTMTDRTFIPASTVRVAQMRLGGQASYNAGMFVPFIGLTYIRDLQSPSQAAFGGQTPANDKDGWQWALGLNLFSRGALSGGVMVTSETGRTQVKNDVFLANIAIRF